MASSRSTYLRNLAELQLEQVELLDAPAARIAGGSRADSEDLARDLRLSAARMRSFAEAHETEHRPLIVREEREAGIGAKDADAWSRAYA